MTFLQFCLILADVTVEAPSMDAMEESRCAAIAVMSLALMSLGLLSFTTLPYRALPVEEQFVVYVYAGLVRDERVFQIEVS